MTEKQEALVTAYRTITQDPTKTWEDVKEDHKIINDTDQRRQGSSRKIALPSPHAKPWKDGVVNVGWWYGEYKHWRELTSGKDGVPEWKMMNVNDPEKLEEEIAV